MTTREEDRANKLMDIFAAIEHQENPPVEALGPLSAIEQDCLNIVLAISTPELIGALSERGSGGLYDHIKILTGAEGKTFIDWQRAGVSKFFLQKSLEIPSYPSHQFFVQALEVNTPIDMRGMSVPEQAGTYLASIAELAGFFDWAFEVADLNQTDTQTG